MSSKISTLALSVSLASTLLYTPAEASIKVAVAANLAKVISSLVSYCGCGAISYTIDSSGNLLSEIENGTVAYDLFLSADETRPYTLYSSYNSLVVGSPFFYAYGSLELYSTSVNISSGLPTPLSTQIVIANPSTAPYGAAAQTVLGEYGITLPNSDVVEKSNIYTTYQAIGAASGDYAYGFVAQSLICRNYGSGNSFPVGYHHSYLYSDPTYGYSRISQWGIKIAKSGQDTTTLNNFVNFLTGSSGQSVLAGYCYLFS
jgi:molybdate transport system substrate-binding protein